MPPQNSKRGAVLAFDVGLKRTGVAVGHTVSGNVQPVKNLAVHHGQLPWQEIDKLVEDWEPAFCVIGDPGSADPHLNKAVRRLIHYLQEHHKQPIERVDETLTSHAANQTLDGSGLSVSRKTELRDQLAACVILESYLQSLD
jgi:putative Holliday junction resolvase